MGRATAGSSAPARDATKIKASLKANGSAYNSAYKRLHQQLEHMYSQVEAAHRELMKSREHHKCLLEMVLHQDLVLQLLHGQLLTLAAQSGDPDRALTVWEAASQQSSASAAAGAGKPSNSHAAQPTPQPNTACSCSVTSMHELQQLVQLPPACEQQVQSVQAGLRTADSLQKASALPTEDNMETMHTQPQLVACSYAAHLLRTTTVEEFRCVTSMTVRDWQEQFHDLFLQLIVLLELVNRCSDLDAEDAPEQDGPPAAEAAAACQAPGGAADATAAGTRDAAGAAAAGQASHPLPATASGRAGPTSSMQQLEALVDTYVRRVLLAYLYNHMPLLEAVMTNYATKQPAVPRASHWEVITKLAVPTALPTAAPCAPTRAGCQCWSVVHSRVRCAHALYQTCAAVGHGCICMLYRVRSASCKVVSAGHDCLPTPVLRSQWVKVLIQRAHQSHLLTNDAHTLHCAACSLLRRPCRGSLSACSCLNSSSCIWP